MAQRSTIPSFKQYLIVQQNKIICLTMIVEQLSKADLFQSSAGFSVNSG